MARGAQRCWSVPLGLRGQVTEAGQQEGQNNLQFKQVYFVHHTALLQSVCILIPYLGFVSPERKAAKPGV